VPSRTVDKDVVRKPHRAVILACALAFALAVTAAPVAFGQTGGSGPPGGTTTDPSTTTTPPTSASGHVFPLTGAHTFGQGFGAARKGHSHQGQDIMAACGTPEVAVSRAKVMFVSFQKLAGNYVVIRDKALHQDYMYAHLAARASVTPKQVVTPGQQIGIVGQTGDATACHLHFEIWQGKWYRGGHAIDPLPQLETWDAAS
jgi:murein DD-endopeptidase MepM/ murein hydrolase activator NlpD